jgi:hypothetical protein
MLPPLDALVSNVTVDNNQVTAVISVPSKTGLFDELIGSAARPAVARQTVKIYCRLAEQQRSRPVGTLIKLLHRAFASPPADVPPSEYNRAALVALAMLVVDERAGDLAGSAGVDSEHCRLAPVEVDLHRRPDWAKHWTLSAALAAGAGTQLSEALGVWKELADSVSSQSRFARGDPSGFSFADLTADRSGFRTARAAIDPERAEQTARWLRSATAERLLPKPLTTSEDGLSNFDFIHGYGSISDRRFATHVAAIDRALDRAGVPK